MQQQFLRQGGCKGEGYRVGSHGMGGPDRWRGTDVGSVGGGGGAPEVLGDHQ